MILRDGCYGTEWSFCDSSQSAPTVWAESAEEPPKDSGCSRDGWCIATQRWLKHSLHPLWVYTFFKNAHTFNEIKYPHSLWLERWLRALVLSRGPRINSQHPQRWFIKYNSSSWGVSALFWPLPALGKLIYIGHQNTYTENKMKNNNNNKISTFLNILHFPHSQNRRNTMSVVPLEVSPWRRQEQQNQEWQSNLQRHKTH